MRFLLADRVFDGDRFLPSHTVLVLDNQNLLKEITSFDSVPHDDIEFFTGIITPGFINAHCHLELSHLKGQIPRHTGLSGFARQVLALRGTAEGDAMEHAMKDADARMWANGIVAVGDISNSSISFPFKQNSRILYHTFLELIGFDPKNSQRIMQSGVDTLHDLHSRGLRGSLAPHSPYSTSSELIELITDYDSKNGWPVSIHSQESSAETAFFKDGSGNINDIYDALKLDISYFSPPGHSSLRAIAPKLRRGPTLLVHNTVMNEDDLLAVKDKNVFFCLCPSANLFIENMLPDFSLFEKEAGRLCIGTDSLASNDSLDVVKEANLILKNTPAIKVEQLLSALTVNAARALNLEHLFGRLIPGKNTGLNLIAEHAGQLQFKQKLS